MIRRNLSGASIKCNADLPVVLSARSSGRRAFVVVIMGLFRVPRGDPSRRISTTAVFNTENDRVFSYFCFCLGRNMPNIDLSPTAQKRSLPRKNDTPFFLWHSNCYHRLIILPVYCHLHILRRHYHHSPYFVTIERPFETCPSLDTPWLLKLESTNPPFLVVIIQIRCRYHHDNNVARYDARRDNYDNARLHLEEGFRNFFSWSGGCLRLREGSITKHIVRPII